MYVQVADKIRNEIKLGIIKPGETIGSQKTLEERFDVSTVTVRQAIQLLKKEELVITNHGKGTFVKPTKVEQNLIHLQSFSEIMKEQGVQSTTQIKKMKLYPIDQTEENKLPLEFGERYLYIERIHLVDGKPIALAVIYIPGYIGENLTIQDLENHSIYWLLENKFNTIIGKAEQIIGACPAKDNLVKLLEVDEDTPLLKAERLSYSDDVPIEKIEFYYLHTAYSFRILLNRANQISMWP